MADYKYKHMSAAEFARNLDETGMTLSQFCRVSGSDYDTVREGMLQARDVPIPHHIRILFALMALPGGLSVARQLTDAVVEKSEEFNTEAKREFGSGREAKAAVEVARSTRAVTPRR